MARHLDAPDPDTRTTAVPTAVALAGHPDPAAPRDHVVALARPALTEEDYRRAPTIRHAGACHTIKDWGYDTRGLIPEPVDWRADGTDDPPVLSPGTRTRQLPGGIPSSRLRGASYDPRMIIKTTFTHTWRSGAATIFAAYPQRIRWMLIPVLVLMPVIAVVTQHGIMLAWMTLAPLLMLVGHGLQIRDLIKHGAIDIVLDDDGFTREQPDKATATMRWSATLGVRWQYGLLVIRTAPRCVATVPASAFNPEQQAQLAEFMDDRFPQTATH